MVNWGHCGPSRPQQSHYTHLLCKSLSPKLENSSFRFGNLPILDSVLPKLLGSRVQKSSCSLCLPELPWMFSNVCESPDKVLRWTKVQEVAHIWQNNDDSVTVLLIKRGSFLSPGWTAACTRAPVTLAQVLLMPTLATLLCCLICSWKIQASSGTPASPAQSRAGSTYKYAAQLDDAART